MSDSTDQRGTRRFSPASRGGERRIRAAVSIARRVVDIGGRYRLRELQLLVIPCGMAFIPALGGPDRTAPLHPLVSATALCAVFLGANAALSIARPWVDQHVFPLLAMLVSTHYALETTGASSLIGGPTFPTGAGLVALYAAFGVALARMAIPPVPPGRTRARAPRSEWPLWVGTALIVTAALVVTLAAAYSLLS